MKTRTRIRWLLLILLLQLTLLLTMQSSELSKNSLSLTQKLSQATSKIQTAKIQETFKYLHTLNFTTPGALQGWEEKVFKGKTLYEISSEKSTGFLKSFSKNASSGLYFKLNCEVVQDLHLVWEWRASLFPRKKDPLKLSNRREDDFAARIYVIFPGTNLFNTNVIEYIWDESLPPGTVANSPFSERIKLVVVRSGKPEDASSWVKEKRNIYEDYQKFFGKKPDRKIGAIAVMSDSDNTGTESAADFKEIHLAVKPKGQHTYDQTK